MLTLTTFEKHLHRALVHRLEKRGATERRGLLLTASSGLAFAPFDAVHDPDLDYPFNGFYEAIAHVSNYEVGHGRPMLSALEVTKETGTPGSGFARLPVHLGFEFGDADDFCSDEVDEVLFVWGGRLRDGDSRQGD